jgi:hypothetical protein
VRQSKPNTCVSSDLTSQQALMMKKPQRKGQQVLGRTRPRIYD